MTEQHFATPQPVRLQVTVAAGEIRITTVDAEHSTVTLDGQQKLIDATRVELLGDRLHIEQRRKSHIGWFGRLEESLHVQVQVPHYSKVEIVTASSDAILHGAFGGLAMKSASGDVIVTGELAGDAAVKTVSGDVRLPMLTGDLAVQTVSGDVIAESVDGSLLVRSVSGDVRVGSLREGKVNVQSVSGDVELGIASGTKIDLDAASASGDVSSEVPLSNMPSEDAGPAIVIRSNTVSGDFRLFRAA
jgi:DUF4097 and DUF4098 domain-containing protein YvlB